MEVVEADVVLQVEYVWLIREQTSTQQQHPVDQ